MPCNVAMIVWLNELSILMSIVTEGEMDVVCQESRATSTLRTHMLGSSSVALRHESDNFTDTHTTDTDERQDKIFIFERETRKLQISV